MASREEKDRPLSSYSQGNLESPFLEEELFVRETEAERRTHMAALEVESPFRSAFELSGPPGAEREGESAFQEPDTEADFERLIEAQLGLTGEDDRKEVPDTTIQPYRWICSIAYEKDGRTLDGGSGLLISNRHVLTAAHVITNARLGEPNAPSLVVYPGRHYGGEPFGRYLARRTRVPNFRLDFGLITLNRPVDPSLLWWGHPSTNTDWWSAAVLPLQQLRQTALPITTAGFPGAKDSYRRKMYEARGETVPGTFGATFRHTADTTEGQSGSPIWTEQGGHRILIGIVAAYDRLPNQIGVFAHDAILQRQVQRWMAEDASRPRPVKRRIALEAPYRWVCRLEVYDNDLRRNVGYGTGLLISDRHALTSARVIHDFSRDRRKYSIHIAPGYEFGKEAFGSTTASKARVSPKFSPETKDGSADYGVLTLSQSLGSATYSSIGNAALGSWGGPSHGLSTSVADWSGKVAHIAAFSRSSGGGGGYHKLRVSSGGIVGLQRGQILHKASSKLDAPGAPIWIEEGGRRLLVGIASSIFSKDYRVNWGCYLSQETLSHLMQWINEDYERSELEAGDYFSQDELKSPFLEEKLLEKLKVLKKVRDEKEIVSDYFIGKEFEGPVNDESLTESKIEESHEFDTELDEEEVNSETDREKRDSTEEFGGEDEEEVELEAGESFDELNEEEYREEEEAIADLAADKADGQELEDLGINEDSLQKFQVASQNVKVTLNCADLGKKVPRKVSRVVRDTQKYTLKETSVTKVGSREEISGEIIKDIARSDFRYDPKQFTCVNWAFQYVNGLKTGTVYYIVPKVQPLDENVSYPGKQMKHDVVYDIWNEQTSSETPSKFISRVFPRPIRRRAQYMSLVNIAENAMKQGTVNFYGGRLFIIRDEGMEVALNGGSVPDKLKDAFRTKRFQLSNNIAVKKESNDKWVIIDEENKKAYLIQKTKRNLYIYYGGMVIGANRKVLGRVDRLKFYNAGKFYDPVNNRKIEDEGWYVERGTPDDESSYRLVYDTKGGPLQIKSGDMLYAAQGEDLPNHARFSLRHAVFVLVEGKTISLWGAFKTKIPEQCNDNYGILYLNVYNEGDYGRRIIIKVCRFEYGELEEEATSHGFIAGEPEETETEEFDAEFNEIDEEEIELEADEFFNELDREEYREEEEAIADLAANKADGQELEDLGIAEDSLQEFQIDDASALWNAHLEDLFELYTTNQDMHKIARIGESYTKKWVYGDGEEIIKEVIRNKLKGKCQPQTQEFVGLRDWFLKKISEIPLPGDNVRKKWLFNAVYYWLCKDLKRKIAAITLAESYEGQEKDIRWIYYNRWMSQGEEGLKGSSPYRKKGMWYKIWMIALGDKTFAKNKGTSGDPKKYKNLSQYVDKDEWFRKKGQKRADKMMELVDEVFENSDKNPYKGWLGQGSLEDFNRDGGKWRKARQYFYLQRQNKVKEELVLELPADIIEHYSFIFDEIKIESFFKKNTDKLPAKVEKYKPKK